MKSFNHFAALLDCGAEDEWIKAVFKLGRDLGYEHMLFALVPNRHTALEKAHIHSNYPPQWRDIYDSKKLVYIDPTVKHCLAHSTPLVWEPGIFTSRQQVEMYEEACSYGLRSGISFPIHGAGSEVGMLCYVNDRSSSRPRSMELAELSELSLMRDFVFESSLRYVNPGLHAEPVPSVTPREMECLKWCAEGKSSWDIAHILHCSEAVVNFHFSNLRRKFNTTSRRQAVVKAIRYGLIYPPV
jgi:LuxR family quorum-sensing transcriptional regulator LasR